MRSAPSSDYIDVFSEKSVQLSAQELHALHVVSCWQDVTVFLKINFRGSRDPDEIDSIIGWVDEFWLAIQHLAELFGRLEVLPGEHLEEQVVLSPKEARALQAASGWRQSAFYLKLQYRGAASSAKRSEIRSTVRDFWAAMPVLEALSDRLDAEYASTLFPCSPR